MPFCSLKRIFNPTKEEQIQDLELYIFLHDSQIGSCSTCAHHIESTMPGFVTDYGLCLKKCRWFSEKACGLKQVSCPYYKEQSIDEFRENLKKLKQELKSSDNQDQFRSFITTRFERKD